VPELPDVTVYVERIGERTTEKKLERVRLASPFVLRSVSPSIGEASGKKVERVHRLGKRIVLDLEGAIFLVIHLMVAGRFRWLEKNAKIPGKIGLAAFDFESGTLVLTEASSKKRASIHLARALDEFDRGGLELDGASLDDFVRAMTAENHTLKRALTDPTILSGIGNAYSDEILHRAKMSPMKQSSQMSQGEWKILFGATIDVLREWTDRLREESKNGFPEGVTAFRAEMAVHGRYGKPCPVCGAPVQRIIYADNETNYCARCQTGGKLLADRSLSRLLRADWPKTLEEMEEKRPAVQRSPNPERSTRPKKKSK